MSKYPNAIGLSTIYSIAVHAQCVKAVGEKVFTALETEGGGLSLNEDIKVTKAYCDELEILIQRLKEALPCKD